MHDTWSIALESDNTPSEESLRQNSIDVSQLNRLILDSAGEGIHGRDVEVKRPGLTGIATDNLELG